MGSEAILDLLYGIIRSYAHNAVTSKLVTVLKIHLLLGKIGLSKTTVMLILLLL